MTITQMLILGGFVLAAGILGGVAVGLVLAHPINQHTHALESELVGKDAAFARLTVIEQHLGFGQGSHPRALADVPETAWPADQHQPQWGEPVEPAQDAPSRRDLTGELAAPRLSFDATDPHQVLGAMVHELRAIEQQYGYATGSLLFDHPHPTGNGTCLEFIIHVALPRRYGLRLTDVMMARVEQAMQSRAPGQQPPRTAPDRRLRNGDR